MVQYEYNEVLKMKKEKQLKKLDYLISKYGSYQGNKYTNREKINKLLFEIKKLSNLK